MKKNVFLAVALLALMAVGAFAQSESDFKVIKTGNAITITGYTGSATAVNIPSRIQNTPVTVIGDRTFASNTKITSVTIPNGVTEIGGWVFDLCTSLTSVTIPNSVFEIRENAFYGCSKLSSVTIPNGVTGIYQTTFADYTSLTNVTIPDSVTRIQQDAFYNCGSLTSVTFQSTINSNRFSTNNSFPGDLRDKYLAGGVGTYTRPNGTSTTWTKQTAAAASQYDSESDFQVTKTGNAITITKYVGTKTTVNIPPTIQNTPVTIIGVNAFMNNSKLTSVTIPKSVTSIEQGAFYGTGLTSLMLLGVTSIGNYAFQNCTSLTSVTIPGGITNIGDSAFRDCTKLTSVTFLGLAMNANGIHNNAFLNLGDLRAKYLAGGPGTYTRPNGTSTTWTKK